MARRWRLPFCTTTPKETTTKTKPISTKETENTTNIPNSRFSFFSSSTPSTPRTSNTLNCRTVSTKASVSQSSSNSPKNSPTFLSCPSSPTTPSKFSLLKTTLRLSKPRCGVCSQSLKTGQGTAIFTAECSHQFHFPCVVDLVRTQSTLICPVCNAPWKELPLIDTPIQRINLNSIPDNLKPLKNTKPSSDLKIYNDDEPLMSPKTGGRFQFNPIPESDYENDEDDSFQGFFTAGSTTISSPVSGSNIEITLSPDTAVISASRGSETVAVLMEVKAPDVQHAVNGRTSSFRTPVDLVAVVDVSIKSNLQTTKRAMRILISSLSSNDRLSIVAFSSFSKRLFPLRRMSVDGRRAARRIVDVMAVTGQETSMSAGDAVRKAAKVLEDRRVNNSVNTIIVLSNNNSTNSGNRIVHVQTTHLVNLNIPIHTISACERTPLFDEEFAKSIERLLSVPVQDLQVQFDSVDVRAVYSCTGRIKWLGSGTGLIKMGDFYADEKREILIELRVPVTKRGGHVAISVRSSYTDSMSQQMVTCRDRTLTVPNPKLTSDPKRSCLSTSQSNERLRCMFITARAVAESRRLAERNDFSSGSQLLTSALALVRQSEFVELVEAEMVDLKRRRQLAKVECEKDLGRRSEEVVLTPTSAWRTAERLAKVARMRKSLNRVSDLHGFENARF